MKEEISIPPENRDAAINRVSAFLRARLPGKPLKVTVAQDRRDRTEQQNRALFGVAYPRLMEHIGLRGEREKLELHEYWMGEWFGWVEYEILTAKKKRPKRTTTTDELGRRDLVSTTVMKEIYEFIQHRAAVVGCNIPDPDPLWWAEPLRKAA